MAKPGIVTYRDHLRETYGGLPRRKGSGAALVIGSGAGEGVGNIGSAIAFGLRNMIGMDVWDPPQSLLDARTPNMFGDYLMRNGPFDTLVLAHGYNHLDWAEDQPIGEVYNQIENGLTSHITASQQFVRHTMKDQWIKNIVFIGSMAYKKVLNGSAVYCAAKAGLAHYSECLGYELTPKGYRVFCVHPSNVQNTPMTERTIQGLMRYRSLSRADAEAYWGDENLMPDWLSAQDIANIVTELVDPAGSSFQYMTGTNIELTGGQR